MTAGFRNQTTRRQKEPAFLPGHCTDIIPRQNNSNRVELFVDGTILDTFYRQVIETAHIRKGDLITEEQYDRLRKDERISGLREHVFRWLALRDHSSGEIKNKSLVKGYTPEETELIINELLAKEFLNDSKFALQFAEEKATSGYWGPLKIRMALSQKGVKKQYIDTALQKFFSEERVIDTLYSAARSAKNRLKRTPSGVKRKKKLVDFLIRKGFHSELVFETADDVVRKLENEEI